MNRLDALKVWEDLTREVFPNTDPAMLAKLAGLFPLPAQLTEKEAYPLTYQRPGFVRITNLDSAERRAMWARYCTEGLEFVAGREGDDIHGIIPIDTTEAPKWAQDLASAVTYNLTHELEAP